jgi:hypothetical protein
MRNVSKSGGECDFRNRLVSAGVIQQHAGAAKNPPVIDVFSDRLTRRGK